MCILSAAVQANEESVIQNSNELLWACAVGTGNTVDESLSFIYTLERRLACSLGKALELPHPRIIDPDLQLERSSELSTDPWRS